MSHRRYITAEEALYIQLLLEDPDSENKKNGLQRLCKFYRGGAILRNPHPVRQTLIGLLYHETAKVRRWALNAIGLVGRKAEHLRPVSDALARYREYPETLISAVSALFALGPEDDVDRLLRKEKIPIEGAVLLASAQHSEAHRQELPRDRVKLDVAHPLELRMAALLIGMNKAPENLFSVRHANAEVIGELNTHEDSLVSQYSIWATAENPTSASETCGYR